MTPKSEICRAFEGHDCNYCKLYSTIFAVVDKIKDHNAEDQKDNELYNEENRKHVDNVHVIDQPSMGLNSISALSNHRKHKSKKRIVSGAFSKVADTPFPPAPVDNKLSQQIINDFCVDSSPSAMEEAGCAVCGSWYLFRNLHG